MGVLTFLNFSSLGDIIAGYLLLWFSHCHIFQSKPQQEFASNYNSDVLKWIVFSWDSSVCQTRKAPSSSERKLKCSTAFIFKITVSQFISHSGIEVEPDSYMGVAIKKKLHVECFLSCMWYASYIETAATLKNPPTCLNCDVCHEISAHSNTKKQ